MQLRYKTKAELLEIAEKLDKKNDELHEGNGILTKEINDVEGKLEKAKEREHEFLQRMVCHLMAKPIKRRIKRTDGTEEYFEGWDPVEDRNTYKNGGF